MGRPISITACIREHWKGILLAHPWPDYPKNSYLGHWKYGGGATGEHSHGIAAWQMFAEYLNAGRIVEVNASMQMVATSEMNYDQISFIHLRTENGLLGDVVQDFITSPAAKHLRIQGTKGFLEWYINMDSMNDGLKYGCDHEKNYEKSFERPVQMTLNMKLNTLKIY